MSGQWAVMWVFLSSIFLGFWDAISIQKHILWLEKIYHIISLIVFFHIKFLFHFSEICIIWIFNILDWSLIFPFLIYIVSLIFLLINLDLFHRYNIYVSENVNPSLQVLFCSLTYLFHFRSIFILVSSVLLVFLKCLLILSCFFIIKTKMLKILCGSERSNKGLIIE